MFDILLAITITLIVTVIVYLLIRKAVKARTKCDFVTLGFIIWFILLLTIGLTYVCWIVPIMLQ